MDEDGGGGRGNEGGEGREAQAMAKGEERVASVESVGSAWEVSGRVGSHVHVCHGHFIHVGLWVPGKWGPAT